jgi:hypothetical protein
MNWLFENEYLFIIKNDINQKEYLSLLQMGE